MSQKFTVLFDLDGTLIDTAPDLLLAHNHVMKKFGYEERELSDIKKLAGGGSKKMLKKSIHTYLPSYAIFWCRRSSDVNRISKPFMELFGIGMKIWDIFLPHKKGPDEEW